MTEPLQVQSEIYTEDAFQNGEVLNNANSLVILEFKRKEREKTNNVQVDDEGDLVVPRKQLERIELEFSASSSLQLVGLQIWRGALLLADFILSEYSSLFEDKIILELGTGVGLTSIVAGICAKEVICTDINQSAVLDLIQRNIDRNKGVIKANMSVKALDFYQEEWSVEMARKLNETNVVIAADVIYDDTLTEAFVGCLTKILLEPPKKIFFLALEKRYVFTIADLDCVPPCYDHFLKYLQKSWESPPMSKWKIEQVETDFEQSFQYERTKHLVLWKITT